MNLRWLLGNFTDPQYKLPWREQFRLSNLAHERYVKWPDFLSRSALIVAPFLLALFGLEPALKLLGYTASSTAYGLGVFVLVAMLWPWSAWMYRGLYVRPIRRAMREAGYDLCIECGYELRGLGDAIQHCPECGTQRKVNSPVE